MRGAERWMEDGKTGAKRKKKTKHKNGEDGGDG